MRRRTSFLRVLVCLVFLGGIAVAQVTTGTILGTASDSTGAVIPGATVTLRNVDTGISRTITTDAAGRYRAPQLPLGNYEVTAEAAGFQTTVRSGITLTVGREALVDFTLQVGTVAEKITVTGEAPLIETTNATVASLVDEKTLRDLPLNGRSFTDLTAIQPGVVSDLGIAANVFGGGKRFVMNGARPQQSLYLLDGTDIVAPYENVAPNSVLGEFLGVDTVREFSVIQTNAGAQYGRAIGGIVNAVTRSGTNELHGGAFEFLRNEAMNANDFFLNTAGRAKPVLKRNQFGGTLGGPIKKDSTFFFLSYEGLQHRLGNALNSRVLTKEARAGWITHCATGVTSCSSPVPQTAADTIKVDPDIKALLDAASPLSNLSPAVYEREGTSRWVGTLIDKGSENYGMVRMDQKVSDQDSFFGRLTIDNSNLDSPSLTTLPSGYIKKSEGGYRFAAIEYTRVFSPTVLNTARVGFNRNNVAFQDTFKASELPAAVYPVPDSSDPTGFNHSGPAVFSGATGISLSGLGGGAFTRFTDNTFIYGDALHWNPGAHAVVIGGNATRYQMNENTHPWGWSNIVFANERSFLQGTIREVIAPKVFGGFARGWRQTYGALFVQDDWKVRSSLTLNLGLRWEMVTDPKEANGKMAGLNDLLRDADYSQFTDSLFHLHDSLKGFAPRFGFAWTPFGEKTVFRGAAGLFKEIPLEYVYQLAIYYPPWSELFRYNAPPWPNPIVRGAPKREDRESYVMGREMDYPRNAQWNFGIERQLSETLVAKGTYVGTRSIGLIAPTNTNQRIPVKQFDPTVGYERWFTPVNAAKPNPNWCCSRSFLNLGDAWYHALQLQLEQRYNHGLNYNVSYTFSKNLETAPIGVKCAELGGGAFFIYNLYDLAAEKSLSGIHAAHNFTASFGYELPFGSGRQFGSNWSGWLNLVGGGWQVNGIFSTRTGQPYTIGVGFDRARRNGGGALSDRPDVVAGRSNNPIVDNWTVDKYYDASSFVLQPDGYYGNVARNTLIAPSITNVNLSLFKEFPMGETRNLQFRAEFFNMPNHPNFSAPGTTVFTSAAGTISSSAGVITGMRTNPRAIQLALKFEF